ncbi:Asp23/Gls24 family envelope stress response protein [Streptomyces sp. NPDC088729]|uniref:Asp23/Gls24 family envelope stress response protein n=1 Tax=Streptomyces sp. NPDC088729 TaxID=3365876 RepID=UPI0038033B95
MTVNESDRTGTSGTGSGSVKGKTTIADSVVAAIAGIAAREVSGVYRMGGGVSRTFGAVKDRVPGSSDTRRGVRVEVGEKQAAIDLSIVVEYGSSIREVAREIRSDVSGAVESMAGLEVVEVNIAVVDVHVPGDDSEDEDEDEKQSPSRVQ